MACTGLLRICGNAQLGAEPRDQLIYPLRGFMHRKVADIRNDRDLGIGQRSSDAIHERRRVTELERYTPALRIDTAALNHEHWGALGGERAGQSASIPSRKIGDQLGAA